MDTTKRLFNIYTWNMINHEFLLDVGVLSKIQTNPDGCVWTWGIPHFFGLLNYKQVTIHHHLPSITNGFSNQKNNIKKKNTILHQNLLVMLPFQAIDCLSFIGFILGHSRQAALCRLEEISVAGEMFII